MSWWAENGMSLIGFLLGGSGVVYGVTMHLLNRRKNNAEASSTEKDVEAKGEAIWQTRYNAICQEMRERDGFWKERYDNLYEEYKEERSLNNEMIKSLRGELNNLRTDYENQRRLDKEKYDKLLYESAEQERKYIARIDSLEQVISEYEKKVANEK